MKTKLALFLFLLLILELPAISQNPQVAVELDNYKVLYYGLDNPITVCVSETPASKVTVSVDNGSVTGSNGKYIVKPTSTDSPLNLIIIVDGREVKKATYRVKTIPFPTIKLGSYESGAEISKSELLNATLNASLVDFEYPVTYEIRNFELTTSVDGNFKTLSSNDNKLTDEMKDLIKSSSSGSKLYFEGIKIKCTNTGNNYMGPVFLVTLK